MAVANVTDIHGGNGGSRKPLGFRVLPHNDELEQRVLGAVVFSQQARELVLQYLEPEHFYDPTYGRIFAAVKRLKGRLTDYAVLKPQLDQDEALRSLNGGEVLTALASIGSTILPDEAVALGHEIQELAVRRGIIHAAEEAANRAYDLSVEDNAAGQIVKLRGYLDSLEREVPQPPDPFSYLDNADLEDTVPFREFLIEKWIPVGCVTSLYGSGGSGKSFLSMMIAMCVASGKEWLGFPCSTAIVLAIMCEDDDDELRRRRNKIARHLNIRQADVAGRLFITARVGEVNAVMEFPQGIATRTPLFGRIIMEAKRLNARLVILDNAAQLFAGNENDRAQVTAFLNACAGIARAINGAVLLLGHPPKTQNIEFSGSTAWDAVVRSRMWFKRLENSELDQPCDGPQRYSLELVKSNYSKRFGVELQENAHGIVECVGDLQKAAKARPSTADRVFNVLRDLFETHRRAIALDEIVEDCIRRGVYTECEPGSVEWRDKRRKVKSNLQKFSSKLDDRGDSYALKP